MALSAAITGSHHPHDLLSKSPNCLDSASDHSLSELRPAEIFGHDHSSEGPLASAGDLQCRGRDGTLAGGLDSASSDSAPLAGSYRTSLSPTPSSAARLVRDRRWLISRIERVFETQLDSLLSGDSSMQLNLMRRPKARRGPDVQNPTAISYPGTTTEAAWRYAVTIRILEMVHEALTSDQTITKRDIYYRDPNLFTKQGVVDRYVDDLAFTFGVPRALLNVTATAKGLIAGTITLINSDGSVADARLDPEGLLISPLSDDDCVDIAGVRWVLVVEKEATFRSLAGSCLWGDLKRHGILITAKGYPDIATRALLHRLSLSSGCLIFGLVDFDPDGLDIISTYKYGSSVLAHLNANLAVPSMKWLGVDSAVLLAGQGIYEEQGLLRLSLRDRVKAIRMLERMPFAAGGQEPGWRRSIQIMLMLNTKAEIQLLEARQGGLANWVRAEIRLQCEA